MQRRENRIALSKGLFYASREECDIEGKSVRSGSEEWRTASQPIMANNFSVHDSFHVERNRFNFLNVSTQYCGYHFLGGTATGSTKTAMAAVLRRMAHISFRHRTKWSSFWNRTQIIRVEAECVTNALPQYVTSDGTRVSLMQCVLC